MDDDPTVMELWRQAHQRVRERKLKAAIPSSNIRDVTEGPLVGQLVSVFSQIDGMRKQEQCDV